MQTVRRHIAEILKENGSATVAQLAEMLGMAQVSVRHHLDILVGEDLVELIGVRRHTGAGRPSQVYALTPNAARLFPQRHEALANHMFAELKASLPSAELQAILQRVATKTAQLAPPAGPDQPIEERLDEVAAFLTDQGYNARWEMQDGCFELHACNCPFSGVSDQNPELSRDGPSYDAATAAHCSATAVAGDGRHVALHLRHQVGPGDGRRSVIDSAWERDGQLHPVRYSRCHARRLRAAPSLPAHFAHGCVQSALRLLHAGRHHVSPDGCVAPG